MTALFFTAIRAAVLEAFLLSLLGAPQGTLAKGISFFESNLDFPEEDIQITHQYGTLSAESPNVTLHVDDLLSKDNGEAEQVTATAPEVEELAELAAAKASVGYIVGPMPLLTLPSKEIGKEDAASGVPSPGTSPASEPTGDAASAVPSAFEPSKSSYSTDQSEVRRRPGFLESSLQDSRPVHLGKSLVTAFLSVSARISQMGILSAQVWGASITVGLLFVLLLIGQAATATAELYKKSMGLYVSFYDEALARCRRARDNSMRCCTDLCHMGAGSGCHDKTVAGVPPDDKDNAENSEPKLDCRTARAVEDLPLCTASEVQWRLPWLLHLPKPLSSRQLLRLEACIEGPSGSSTSLCAPLSGQTCVLYSVAVTRQLHEGMHPAPVAFASACVDFVISLRDAPDVRINVKGKHVSLFHMRLGSLQERQRFSAAPTSWQEFVLEHLASAAGNDGQTSSSIYSNNATLEFQEYALVVGVPTTFVGELHRDTDGSLSLTPLQRGGLSRELSDPDLDSCTAGSSTSPVPPRRQPLLCDKDQALIASASSTPALPDCWDNIFASDDPVLLGSNSKSIREACHELGFP